MSFKTKTLSIIAHLPHKKSAHDFYAYEPYVREIEVWSELFDNVNIYTEITHNDVFYPLRKIPSNCSVKHIGIRSGSSLFDKFHRIFNVLPVTIKIYKIILKSDLLHLRSPGYTTIIANSLNKFLNKPTIIKWATKFGIMPLKNPLINWEYKLLKVPPTNTRVLIYDNNPKSINQIPFFPAIFKNNEIKNIDIFLNKKSNNKLKFLCVGRLTVHKQFDRLINFLCEFKFNNPTINWSLKILGDGPEKNNLMSMCKKLNLETEISFEGSKSFIDTEAYYKESDFSFIPGEFEGWCKVINESWRFGVIPIVTSLGNTSYPILFSDGAGIIYNNNFEDFNKKVLKAINLKISEVNLIRKKGCETNKKMDLYNFKKSLKNMINHIEKPTPLGLKVIADKLDKRHLKFLNKLYNDKNIARLEGRLFSKQTLSEQKEWFEKSKLTENDYWIFSPFHKLNYVGYVSFKYTSKNKRTGRIGIKIKPEFQGNGYGTDILKSIEYFYFNFRNVKKLTTHIIDYNEISLSLFLNKMNWKKSNATKKVILNNRTYNLIYLEKHK